MDRKDLELRYHLFDQFALKDQKNYYEKVIRDNRRAAVQVTRYRALLGDAPLALPHEAEGRHHVWHLYVVRHAERNRLQQALAAAGIATGLHYSIPVHLQPAYVSLGYRVGDFPVAERVAQQCLSLPIYAELSEKEQEHIAHILKYQSNCS